MRINYFSCRNFRNLEETEIKDFDEIIEVINKCDVCRLAINDGDYPYIVPMNFGLNIEDGKVVLYFHCASEGKKLELLKKNKQSLKWIFRLTE
mgnify:CR=1 FL=1